MSSPLLTLLLVAATSASFQTASSSPDLASLIRDLPAKAEDDPSASQEFRKTATTILPCWDNDGHHNCQYMSNAVNVP